MIRSFRNDFFMRFGASACVALLLFCAIGCASGGTASLTPPAIGTGLGRQLDDIAGRLDEQGAIVAMRVLDAQSGEVLYTHGDIDFPLKPASNMKLLTAALAIETFGPDRALTTSLVFSGEDLWVIGSGDPGTGDPTASGGGSPTDMFDPWIAALKARGITRITGNLIIDDLSLDSFFVHPTWWPEDDLQAWYGAPIGGLNFNVNCVNITAWPTRPGEPVRIGVVPAGTDAIIVNELVTAEVDGVREPTLVKLYGENHYVLTGTLLRETTFSNKPVMDPGLFFAQAMRSYFSEHGIVIVGETVRSETPLAGWAGSDDPRTVAVHQTLLPAVLSRILKPSQNMFADCMSKIIGLEYHQRNGIDLPGSWLAAARSTYDWLESCDIDTRGLVFADGSGLSHNNRVTARLLSDLLLEMHHHEHAVVWHDSLSIGGVDGTLRRRFTQMPGRVVGKTGTITGACSLSGYVTTNSGRLLVFSILVNGNQSSAEARTMQDDAVRLLMRFEE